MTALNPFSARTATLRSPLSPEACAERIAAITDNSFAVFGTRPLIGSASARSASLRRRINYRNSFQTELSALFEPAGNGTTIRCRFALLGVVQVFMAIWIGGALFAAGSILLGTVGVGTDTGAGPMFALIPLVFLAFGFVMVAVGRGFARNEESYILETVRAATDASVVEREPGYADVDAAEMERMAAAGPLSPVIVAVVVALVLAFGVIGAAFYLMNPVR